MNEWRAGARRILAGLLFAVLAAGCGAPPEPSREPADLILHNAYIYTLNPQQPWAQALAIRDGVIVRVGNDADVLGAYDGPARDLDGQMVLPGFHDAHTHPITSGMELAHCYLGGLETVEAIVGKVRECDRALPEGEWLRGDGWNLSLFPEANPHRSLLDAVSAVRPMVLVAEDGHSAWVNGAALAAAGIGADTPDPPNGVIERDAAGEPSGTLRESAQELVRALLPPPTDEERIEGALRALAMASRYGITSLVDAAVGVDELRVWKTLEADGRLTARVVASIGMAGALIGAGGIELIDPESRATDAQVRTHSAKLFVDGVLEGETAALLEPYIGRDGRTGSLRIPAEELATLVTSLDARGVQVHMHAIGDAAVRAGLDAVAAARTANGASDNRHFITHLQLVHPDDYPRFRELGVLANFQALWAYPDAYITEVNLPVVGPGRVARMYPIGSIHRQGGMIVGGSDWSVSSMNPLEAIETAVTREDPSGRVDGVLNEDERVPLPVMLAAYTRNGAFLMHQEDRVGSIEEGKLADVVVLERNLFELDPHEIGEVEVIMTLLGGRIVYERAAQAAPGTGDRGAWDSSADAG
jgi:predicted amidohydrolase YtcJ